MVTAHNYDIVGVSLFFFFRILSFRYYKVQDTLCVMSPFIEDFIDVSEVSHG